MYQLISSGNINRLDTPYFSSIEEQNNYFNARIVHRYDGYFPPYYTNAIRVSLSEFNIFNTTVVDYLRLQWNSKWYYYFIDNKMYINEDIVELSLTMDVVQTFLFNFTITNGTVTRQSIKRWNSDGTINRKYIRENLSQGNFENSYYFEYDKPIIPGLSNIHDVAYYILITTEPLTNNNLYTRIDDIVTSLYYYLIPSTLAPIKYNDKNLVAINFLSDTKLLSQPSVYKMFAITNTAILDYFMINISSDIVINYRADAINISPYKPNDNYNIMQIIEYRPYEFNNKSITKAYHLEPILFEKNSNLKKLFKYYYCPVVFDTNYIHLEFGEKMQFTTFPLDKANNTNISAYFKYDMNTNTRAYFMCDGDSEIDNYNTVIQNSSIEEYEIVTDYWLQYQAQHKGDLTTGIALARFNNGYSALSSAVTGLSSVASGVATGNVGKQITGTTQGLLSLSNYLVGAYNIDQNLKITRENMEATPNTVKQGNNMQSDKYTNAYITMSRAEIVNDIEEVAKKYELYGYKTNEIINDTVELSKYQYRNYWNILAIENANIKATSSLLSENEKALIKERLASGLRFINVSDMTLSDTLDYNFKYDNVEK